MTRKIAPHVRSWLAQHDPDLDRWPDDTAGDYADRMIRAGVVPADARGAAQRYVSEMRAGRIRPISDEERGEWPDEEERHGQEAVEAGSPDERDSVEIDWDAKEYSFTFTVRSERVTWDAPFREVSEWAWLYTHSGEGRTARDVALRSYETYGRTISERWMSRALRVLGLLKSSPPLAPHELVLYPRKEQQEELVWSRRQARAAVAVDASERRQLRRLVRDLKAKLGSQEHALERMVQAVDAAEPINPAPLGSALQRIETGSGQTLAVCGCYDLHIGKRAGAHGLTESKEAVARAARLMRDLLHDRGVDRIAVVLGGDFLHIDSVNATTTRGTAQDVDAGAAHILHAGVEAAIDYVEVMVQLAPVEVVIIPGNHDATLTWALVCALRQRWMGHDTIHCPWVPGPRRYYEWGRILLGFEHGDGPKPHDLASVMASEAREAMGRTDQSIWVVGHLHHEWVRDVAGALVVQLPTIVPPDEWHIKQGFVNSRRAHKALLIDAHHGWVGSVMAHPG